jgi:hypothetical protein
MWRSGAGAILQPRPCFGEHRDGTSHTFLMKDFLHINASKIDTKYTCLHDSRSLMRELISLQTCREKQQPERDALNVRR